MIALPLSTAYRERDIDGLTDRTYLEVVGRCVLGAGVSVVLYEVTVTAPGPYIVVPALGFLCVFAYLFSWVDELLRQTILYVGTRRYGSGFGVSR
jgi:hypothetical protein